MNTTNNPTNRFSEWHTMLIATVAVILSLWLYSSLTKRQDAAIIKQLQQNQAKASRTKIQGHDYISVSVGKMDRLMPTCFFHDRQCLRCIDNSNQL